MRAILAYRDPEVAALQPTNAGWTDGVDTVSYERMMWHSLRDRRVLSDTVRWAGDEAGVVVAAETETIAEEALRLLDIEWDVLPFVLDPIEAMQPGAPLVHRRSPRPTSCLPTRSGDRTSTSRRATWTTRSRGQRSWPRRRAPTTTPTRGRWRTGAAWPTGINDRLTIWSNSYEPTRPACT